MLLEYLDALRYLERHLAGTCQSEERLLIVNGGLTSGKTELLQEFASRVEASGALFLSATASREHQSFQGDVVDQLCHSRGLPADVSDRVSSLLSSGGLGPADHADMARPTGDGARAVAVRETCSELLRLARRQPVVVSVDDVQFADSFSLELLLCLRRRMESARIMIVLGKWDWAPPTLPRFLAEMTRHPHGWVRLAPLSESGVAALLTERAEQPPEPGLIASYRELTGGNLTLVNALIEDQRGGGRVAERGVFPLPVVGSRYLHAVLTCLHRWDPQLLDVAQALAILGENSTPALLSRLSGVNRGAVENVLQILLTDGLLTAGPKPDGHRFRHPAVAGALLNGLTAEDRSQRHLRAAELLHQRGFGARCVARQLGQAGSAAGGWSLGVLREAAEQALAHDDAPTAVRCLELALEATLEPADRDALRLALARAAWRTSPSVAGLYMTALPGGPGAADLNRRDAATLVRHALWQGDSAGVERGMRMLESSGGAVDDGTTACLRLAHRWFHGPGRREDDRVDLWHGTDPVRSGWHTYTWSQAVWCLGAQPTHASGPQVVSAARRVRENCELSDTTLETVTVAVLTLAHAGAAGEAIRWCDALRREAARRNATTWLAVLESVRADVALGQGDLTAAAQLAGTAYRRLSAAAWGVFISYPLSILISAGTELGDEHAVAEYLRQVLPDSTFSTVWGLRYLRARGHHHLAADRVLSAVSDFQACGDLAEQLGVDVPALHPWRGDLAQADLRLGRTVVAQGLLNDQLDRFEGLDGRIRGRTLRLLASCAEPERRRGLLESAVALLEDGDDRLELSLALEDMSQLLHRSGEDDLARSMARRAAQEARICRTGTLVKQPAPAPVAAVAGPEVPRPAVAVRPVAEELSEAEHRVAALAARGHTNREISDRLFITVSTVEQHLTRVYRKLGVTRRSDLPTRLGYQRDALET